MLFAESRRPARRDRGGAYVPLSLQNVALWDLALIGEAEARLQAASAAGRLGRFQLEAAIQSVHATRSITGRTDWDAIVGLYDGLIALTGSPVAAINRAVALAEAGDPPAGLSSLAEVEAKAGMVQYQPYWAAKAELAARCGDPVAADAAYASAIGLSTDPAVREFLNARRQALRN